MKYKQAGITPAYRLKAFRKLLTLKPLVRFLEAHNGLTGLIVENTKINKNGKILEFDGMWEGSLTDSASKGKPDTAVVSIASRIQTIEQILEVTTKPMIVDGDSGGSPEQFALLVKSLERLGVSAVIIEDTTGAKINSFADTGVKQAQDTIEDFCNKIFTGKRAHITDDFMIIARIESLTLGRGLVDALKRAKAYINAGADGIMIHSKEKTPKEIFEFCKEYRKFGRKIPLAVVPSAYNRVTEEQLVKAGIRIVIYANQLLRSVYPVMVKTAESILRHSRSYEADKSSLSLKDLLELIPTI